MVAKLANKFIDGHCIGLNDLQLNAYCASGIRADHESCDVDELKAKLSRGMYVLLREGSACHDLRTLLKAITPTNSRRSALCSDGIQPKTILEEGHLDNKLKICVEEGLDPIQAIQMATLNSAECFNLKDRGAIAPGLLADLVVLEDLENFKVLEVYAHGQLVASDKNYLLSITKEDISKVKGSLKLKDFSIDKLKLKLDSNLVNAIELVEGGLLSKKTEVVIDLNDEQDFVYNHSQDLVKVAVLERHNNTGNIAIGILKGYGLNQGAIALSIAHDSHNILVADTNNEDMAYAVECLVKQEGGIVLVNNLETLGSLPMPIGGIMSDQSGKYVSEKLSELYDIAYNKLNINKQVDPVNTLCFMSLVVLPELKLTDQGLFDVNEYRFINLEVNKNVRA